MRVIVDTNIVLNNILGSRDLIASAVEAGIELLMPEAQIFEAVGVLVRKIHIEPGRAQQLVEGITRQVDTVEMSALQLIEQNARARLHERGQPDWPVVAAALLLDADIWTNDRDFFGVGVAVWCDETIKVAFAQAA